MTESARGGSSSSEPVRDVKSTLKYEKRQKGQLAQHDSWPYTPTPQSTYRQNATDALPLSTTLSDPSAEASYAARWTHTIAQAAQGPALTALGLTFGHGSRSAHTLTKADARRSWHHEVASDAHGGVGTGRCHAGVVGVGKLMGQDSREVLLCLSPAHARKDNTEAGSQTLPHSRQWCN